MAVRHGYGKIAGTDALVFAYDTGDTRNSYRGEPTTNLALFDIASAGFSTDTPSNLTQTSNNTEFTYKGRPSRKMVIGSGYWNCYIYNYNTSVSSTVFAASFKVKAADGSNPSTFIGGGYIYGTAGSFFPSPSFTAIDDGWYICYIQYSGTAMTLTSITGVNGSGGPKTFYITDYQVEAKTHFTPFTPGNTTRSSTQGLLDLTGNYSIDLANVSFDSNAQIYFDGSNDVIDIPNSTTLFSGTQDLTVEAAYNMEGQGGGAIFGNYGPSYTTDHLWFSGMYGIWLNSGVYAPGYPLANGRYHMVGTRESGVMKLYLNGVLVNSGTRAASIATDIDYRIGADVNGAAEDFTGDIYVVKAYSRALSAAEVLNNYNFYKSRFNL